MPEVHVTLRVCQYAEHIARMDILEVCTRLSLKPEGKLPLNRCVHGRTLWNQCENVDWIRLAGPSDRVQ
jgi:hypothetical protein